MHRVLLAVGARRWPVLQLLALGLWLALAPASASAEELNAQGNLVFSAERFFGFYFDHESVEIGDRDVHNDCTSLSLGWSRPDSLLMTPRLGIDYFLSRNFTLGGNIGFFSNSVEDVSRTGFLLGFRVGYALRLAHVVSLWPRGGFTYITYGVGNSSADYYTLALTLDAPFTFALTEGFAFSLGPTLDLGFLAERGDRDASEVLFGMMFGLTGWTNL
jgi:hypothetical protein